MTGLLSHVALFWVRNNPRYSAKGASAFPYGLFPSRISMPTRAQYLSPVPGETGCQIGAIGVVSEDDPPLRPPHPDEVGRPRGLAALSVGAVDPMPGATCYTWQRPYLLLTGTFPREDGKGGEVPRAPRTTCESNLSLARQNAVGTRGPCRTWRRSSQGKRQPGYCAPRRGRSLHPAPDRQSAA